MNFLQFVLILKARARVVVSIFVLIVLGTFVVTKLLPKSYTAMASLVLNAKGVDPVTGMTLPAQMMPGFMPTQVDIIKSQTVALKVVENLKLTEIPSVQERFKETTEGTGNIKVWMADLLLANLEARPSRESNVMQIVYTGSDPTFAATVANAFSDAYRKQVLQLKMDPAHIASSYFEGQIEKARKDLQVAQSKLSAYEEENGITNIIAQGDVETSRLNELSAQLSALQTQTIESEKRHQTAHANAADSPDVAATPIVQSLKSQLASAESKLAELAQRVAKNHPQYIAAEAEINKIKSQLAEETVKASAVVGGAAKINRAREMELREQVEVQKKKLLEFNRTRDELTVLAKDVDDAQHNLDTLRQRYTQTTIESQANLADIALLSEAVPPNYPSSPRVFLNLAIATFVGFLMAIGAGLATEMFDRTVRGADDVADILDVPVFSMRSGKPKINPVKQFLQQLRAKFKRNRRTA